jgi:probable phosphoglycerate mutase
MLQVYLVRHGETQWNAERRIQGQSDSPLTEKGVQQAWQVAERARTLGITHVITSDRSVAADGAHHRGCLRL